MKRLLAISFALLLLVLTVLPACAEASLTYVVDEVGILDPLTEAQIAEQLRAVSEKWNVTAALLLVDSLEGKTATEYADDYYDYVGLAQGWSEDGILLLISVEERRYAISTSGKVIDAMDEERLDEMEETILPALRVSDYSRACRLYAQSCEDLLGDAFAFPLLQFLGIALIAGVLVAWGVTSSMTKKLKSVQAATVADHYMKKDSLQLTGQSDRFLYASVSKTPRPKDTSSGGSHSHVSSSGHSHGGRSGGF